MTVITQQDTPQTETPKLQHITTKNRPQPLQHQYYRISSTRFHTSAQETVGSGALVSAWLFLGNTIPLPRWQRMELFRQKIRQGKISPPFLTAKFSPRNSPLAKFSLPLYGTDAATNTLTHCRPLTLSSPNDQRAAVVILVQGEGQFSGGVRGKFSSFWKVAKPSPEVQGCRQCSEDANGHCTLHCIRWVHSLWASVWNSRFILSDVVH